MGSDSDLAVMQEAAKILDKFQIPYDMTVASAHRSPQRATEFAGSAIKKGIKVIIAGAGHAAHLAGVLAAHTRLPVIGVPIDSSCLQGLDALLATVQMPPGIPVATMAIAVPTGVKIINWTLTMWGGKLQFTTAMLFAVGLIVQFTLGGLSGVTHSVAPSDTQQTDTY